jgi:hypothetical protein
MPAIIIDSLVPSNNIPVNTKAYATEIVPLDEGRTTLTEAVKAPRIPSMSSSFQWDLYPAIRDAFTNKYAPMTEITNM